MKDLPLIEETIRMRLRKAQHGLSASSLENHVAGTLGRSGDPVEMTAYDTVLNNLLTRGLIREVPVLVEGYKPHSTELVPGYRLA